jgi:hypothetical protein
VTVYGNSKPRKTNSEMKCDINSRCLGEKMVVVVSQISLCTENVGPSLRRRCVVADPTRIASAFVRVDGDEHVCPKLRKSRRVVTLSASLNGLGLGTTPRNVAAVA